MGRILLPEQSQSVAATNDSQGGHALRLPVFFIGWTPFAASATWWLIHSANSEHLPSQLLFDSSQNGQIPIVDQIRRWLRISDLSLRGAYPWVLLAPYVVWLTARFLLERGRLRVSLPVHLLACGLFAIGSQMLTTRSMAKRNFVVRVFETREGKMTHGGFLTNRLLASVETPNATDQVSVHSYTSHLGNIRTKVIVSAGPGEQTLPAPLRGATNNLTTNSAPEEGLFQRLGPGADRLHLEATAHAGWRSSMRYESQLFSSLLNVLAYASLAGLVHAVYFYRRARERESRAVVLESHLARARLHSLQAQLQPHFLFNALNAVSTLLHRDARAAQDALTSFSELLRLSLNQSDKQEVLLREDLQFLERYVEIQQTRLGDRFSFEQTVEPSTLNCLVPTLFLQPLVENSIRHGIELSSNPGMVRIAVQPNGERLLLTVEDNGVGLTIEEQQRKTGTGLSNLRARLETLYGRNQKLEVVSRAGGGVAVRLEIPLRRVSDSHHEIELSK